MSAVNLGDDFNAAVLQAAGLDPAQYEASTLSIDFVPTSGDATIRVTRVASVDAVQLRQLIAATAQPPAS
jgi:hypothetical protein